MILLKRSYQIFFIIGIFFLPFNSDVPKWLGFLGEYSADSSPIFFLIGFALLLAHQYFKRIIYFPFKSNVYSFFLLFFALIFISTLLNLPNILEYYFKQTWGIIRFLRQIISIIISGFIFFYLFVNVCRDYGSESVFLLIRKVFFISFIFVFSCGIIEFLIVTFNFNFLTPIINIYNYLPFVEVKLYYGVQRISSLTYEPPALGTYLITISGFMFSYILTSKKSTRYIPFLLVVLLAILSKSRTALVVVFLQAIAGVIFAYYIYPDFRKLFNKLMVAGSVLGIIFILFFGNVIYESVSERIESFDFSKTDYNSEDNSISNKSRLGIQLAMFETFKDYPVFGTGWGQQAYESRFHYPNWAIIDNYEFSSKYLNQREASFPPGYNLYLRILTETGIVGLTLFLLFLYSVFKTSFITFKKSKKDRYIAVALIICFVGLAFNWLQTDTFRVYGFWLCLALLIIYKKNIDERLNRFNTTL
jgi:O-antigen ligase